MPHDAATLQAIIDYCDARWIDADQRASAAPHEMDLQTGRKTAYNDVLHHARKLIDEGA